MTELDLVVDDPNPAYNRAFDEAVHAFNEACPDLDPTDPDVPTYYLAGQMTGLPQFNFPAFNSAAEDLRRRGYFILSPAEMDEPEVVKIVMQSKDGRVSEKTGGGWPRSHFLKRDFLIVVEVDGVICLPNWHLSSGARDETRLAMALEKPVLLYPNLTPIIHHPYLDGMDPEGFGMFYPDECGLDEREAALALGFDA